MQTQCPHCDTRFRVTETQVTAADGFVRCGICHEVFNAYEVAKNNLQHANDDATADSVETYTEPANEETTQADLDLSSADNLDLETVYTPEVETSSSSDDFMSDPFESDPIDDDSIDSDQTLSETELAENEPDEPLVEHEDTAQAADTSELEIEVAPQEENKVSTFDEVDATDPARKDAFDFFDEKITQPLPHVVPEKFKDNFSSNSHSTVSTLLWSIGILVLTTTLMLQYIWYNRDQFHEIPEIQSTILTLCEQVDCADLTVRNPEKIKLISRNVYTHPKEKSALMIDLTIKNDAEFAQPFPVLQIDFSDVRGGTVAARQFLPQEYLSIEETQIRLIPPYRSIDVSLEIKDPGKQAMTYEFEFL